MAAPSLKYACTSRKYGSECSRECENSLLCFGRAAKIIGFPKGCTVRFDRLLFLAAVL